MSQKASSAVSKVVDSTQDTLKKTGKQTIESAKKISMSTKEIILSSLSDLKSIMISSFFLFIVFYVTFLYSQEYRVNKTIYDMRVYKDFLTLDSDLNLIENQELRLCDYYIASSFRPYCGKNQMLDYLSIDVLEKVLEAGARALWLDIFNSDMTIDAEPVLSVGKNKGNWTYSLNFVKFEDAIKKIAETAFNPGKVNNYNDPLILVLNLNVQDNVFTINKVKDILIKHLRTKLLPPRYGYANKNIGHIKMKELMRKIIIITNKMYKNSDMLEIINGTYDNTNIRKINYKSLVVDKNDVKRINIDVNELKNFNTNNLSLIIPEELTLFTYNYDHIRPQNFGCQFIFMNYQKVFDEQEFMDKYISKFRESSFVKIPERYKTDSKPDSLKLKREKLMADLLPEPNDDSCPSEPSKELRVNIEGEDYVESIRFKNTYNDQGVCLLAMSEQQRPSNSWIESKNKFLGPIYSTNGNNDSKLISHDGNSYRTFEINDELKLYCSSKVRNIVPPNYYYLAPQCKNQSTDNYGKVMLKLDPKNENQYLQNLEEDGKLNIVKKGDSNYVNMEMCKIKDQGDCANRDSQFCLLSKNKCPPSFNLKYDNNLKLINGSSCNSKWNLCCKGKEIL